MIFKSYSELSHSLWNLVHGNPDLLKNLSFDGPESFLPSRFDVTAFASTSIGVATLAAAELQSNRSKRDIRNFLVNSNSTHACAAFKGDSLFKPIGWTLPSPWDPFAGDYPCGDHWIRLHTNYSYHRDAVFKVLGRQANREELAAAVSKKQAEDLEQSIFEAGGCSAIMYDRQTWMNHTHGKHTLEEKIIHQEKICDGEALFGSIFATEPALSGIRVLDMTRVISGLTCTKFLSAHGADVLRIDPPNFAEVEGLLPETTVGKRRAFLDIKSEDGRKTFEQLIQNSHVFVHGLRPDALEKLGIDLDFLKRLNPNLIVASLNAYGSKGPWKNRTGFDSLVQMSSGIAESGTQYKKSFKPISLPVQALDHGTGYLMATAICRSLSELFSDNKVNSITGSLIGAANLLQKFDGNFEIEPLNNELFASTLVEENTAWGPALRVRCPATINNQYRHWIRAAGPLGQDLPIYA